MIEMKDFYKYLQYELQFRPATLEGYRKTLGKVKKVFGTLKLKERDCKDWMRDMQKRVDDLTVEIAKIKTVLEIK